MLHSVGNDKSSWCQNWLSMSLIHFEEFCKYLSKNNYETCFLDDWYKNHELEGKKEKKEKKQVFLTFDDGYLDNWVNAYPILKKYNLKATIFINPEFVDPSELVRPNLEDVWNENIKKENLQTLGFLNWEEIKLLDQTDLIDIQNHSMSHNYYFKSSKIIDIYVGQDKYHWLSWIIKPERKAFWQIEDQKNYVPFGTPIFEYDRALGLRRYFPNSKLVKNAIKYFNENFSKKEIIEKLNNEILELHGEVESDSKMIERYSYELINSKSILEKKLNKKIDYLCWPGGGYNTVSQKIAENCGYKASTIASKDKKYVLDNSSFYKRIPRFGLNSISQFNNKFTFIDDKKYVVKKFLANRNHPFFKNYFLIRHYYLRIKDIFFKKTYN